MKNQPNSKKFSINISPLSYEEVRMQIKAMLPAPVEFDDDHNLIELGLNSLKIMRLVNNWRRAGAAVAFAELIAAPRLSDWWSLLQKNNAFSAENEQAKVIEGHGDVNRPFPLTDVQYAYWVGRRDDQPLGGVGCHAYLEIDGRDVEPQRLESAWGQLLEHHSLLRARFLADGQQEVLNAPFTKALSVHDLRLYPEDGLVLELSRIRDRLSHRLLAVEEGEVAGIELSLLPGGNTRIHFDIDLLVADVQSLHIILRDLAALYARGVKPPAPKNWSFAQYLKGEGKRRAKEKEMAAQYWKDQLEHMPKAPELPLAKKPETIKNPVFRRRTYFIGKGQWSFLQKHASAHRITPAMVLLTVYAAVIDRWSANSRFLLNLPLFDRQIGENGVDDVVADFTSLLLLPVDCAEPQSFLELAQAIQAKFHEAVANASYSGVQIQRDMARIYPGESNFAPVVFACNLGTPLLNNECRQSFGSLTYMISQTPQVWLDFQLYESDGGLLLAWDAVEQLFPEYLIDDMFGSYVQLIKQLADSEQAWKEIPDVLPAAQQQRRKKEAALSLPVVEQCIHTSFFEYATKYPESVAVIDSSSDMKLSYGELSVNALKIASMLKEKGVKKGDTVAITLPRGAGQIEAVFGVLAAGACYVPVSVSQPDARRAFIHKKANIECVLTDNKRQDAVKWPENTIVLNTAAAAEYGCLEQIEKTSAEDLAYIIFTSGSTGEPKGVEITHYGAWNTISDINKRCRVTGGDRILAVSSLDFDLSVYDIFGLLSAGGTIVTLMEDSCRDAAYWLKAIMKYQITMWNSAPVLLDMLLVAAESKKINQLHLRVAMLSGDWIGLDIPVRLKNVETNCTLLALGGATEASIWSNSFSVTLPLPKEWVSIPYGRPLSNQTYRIVDAKGNDTPDWAVGELWIGGAGVAKGYCGDESLTKERFVDWNGMRWYKTGDMGRFWPDNNIEFLGRKDFQVKIRGHRIELGEIETVLKKHPGVKEAVIAAVQTDKASRQLVGYIVPEYKNNEDLKEEHLSDYLKKKLPEYMVPSVFLILDKLPVSASGKVERKALPMPGNMNRSRKEFIHAETKVEQCLVEIWSKAFALEKIGVTDNYFNLGGDSLLGTKICAEVHNELGVELLLTGLFEKTTIAELAEYIQELMDEKENAIFSGTQLPAIIPEPANRNEPFPLTNIQLAYWVGRSGAYTLGNVSSHCYFEIEETGLDVGRVNRAWQRLVDHHDMLRAVIMSDGQQQKILEKVPFYYIEVCDLRNENDEYVAAALEAIKSEMSHQVLSADEWPLFEIKASIFGENRVRLHISLDNIILDGWSIFHLLGEWAKIYKYPEISLPAVNLSFRDYVIAWEKMKETELYKRSAEYWLGRLETLPSAPELPLAKNPESIAKQRFRRLQAKLNCETWTQLKDRAKKLGITPSSVLMSAFAEALCLWCKNPKFTINVTLFNRLPLHKQINNVIGDFTSLVLLEVDNTAGQTFAQRCLNIQRRLTNDLSCSYFDGVEVQRKLAKMPGKHQYAAMPVVFTSTLGVMKQDNTEWLGKLVYSITQTPQVWLDHQVQEQEGELLFNWDIVEGLFPEGLTEDTFKAYCSLLQSLSAAETVWHEAIPNLVPVPGLANRLKANETDGPVSNETLISLFEKQVVRRMEYKAVITSDSELTYEELSNRSFIVSELLSQKNITKASPVAIVMEKGWEQVAAALGILKCGAAYVPIDSGNPEERIWKLLKDADASVVLTQSWLAKKFTWPEDISILTVDEHSLAEGPVHVQLKEALPGDLAYVMYTSGSTGFPKGVMIQHQGAVNTILDINKRFSIGPEDKVLALSNMNFDLSVYDVFGMLAEGASIVMPDAGKVKEPAHWLELIIKEKITVWNTVPAFMQMLLEYMSVRDVKTEELQSLRLVLLSGDWIPLDLPDKIRHYFKNTQIVSLGGATEASIWSNLYPIDQIEAAWKSIPYGKPLTNQRYYVLSEFLRDCPVWVPGKLYIGGLGVARGYLNDEEKTKEKFIIHPHTGERLYNTGDFGRYWPDGNIEFLGREDFQVKIKGYRIELGEVEAAIRSYERVKEAVVVIENDHSALCAAVVPYEYSPDNNLEYEIYTDLSKKLPSYCIPGKIAILESLPLSDNGKVDRKAVGNIVKTKKAEETSTFEGPRDELEHRIAGVWSEVLEVQKISRNDDFFLLGGDSLKAVRISGQLQTRKISPARISLQTLFEASTIASLAEKIRNLDIAEPNNYAEGIL
ncbi:amino acid adenylation domain protein [Desulfofarcimen acetoxidans DSM 771]|uniref:Amino acid adenylation domain protein n=1 Tax=Desulfofarcimen acetoxidans (strain ATCC 49208 / DSM 771 / KCTC 5769 / VKM B-1644 / 5575) TaxID=485916 RepID=C8W161_DESAS|nr:non-ribosomal peptide synthetase [Desulfofarcimen acetoxidans]ACV63457.1 amino acid adenylation domain protein [Desulfofarcimen acetoxidans DSM 771]